MRFHPAPSDGIPLIPILHHENSQQFIRADLLDPRQIPNTEYITSALRFGASINLLEISQTPEMEYTDTIDPNLSIKKFFYEDLYGDVNTVDLTVHPFANFCMGDATDPRKWELKMQVEVSVHGTPTTHVGKLFHKLLNVIRGEKKAIVTIYGSVNLQNGEASIDASCLSFAIRPLGYTLHGHRVNLNRQAKAAGCPYMS